MRHHLIPVCSELSPGSRSPSVPGKPGQRVSPKRCALSLFGALRGHLPGRGGRALLSTPACLNFLPSRHPVPRCQARSTRCWGHPVPDGWALLLLASCNPAVAALSSPGRRWSQCQRVASSPAPVPPWGVWMSMCCSLWLLPGPRGRHGGRTIPAGNRG